jgi:arylsulfatase A-like enzyme
MNVASRAVLAASAVLALALAAEAAPARADDAAAAWRGDSVILISLGNVGAARSSLYGYPRKTTPRLDAWAKSALVFDDAFTPASWTLPVGVSLFSSLYPYTHGVNMRWTHNSLSTRTVTLPELLRDAGYATAAFTGGLDYNPAFSHLRGFQTAPENPNFTRFSTTLPQAEAWLKDHADGKFFLFVHGYDAHCPFASDPPYAGSFSRGIEHSAGIDFEHCLRGFRGSDGYVAQQRSCANAEHPGDCSDARGRESIRLTPRDIDYLGARYDDSLLEEDALVGGFLESLDPKLLARTLVVVVADHGEMFAKHGRFGRAGTLRGTHYDDVLRVPLLMKLPGVPGRRIDGLAQTIDVMPTLLAALGLPAPAGVQGRDLGPLISRGVPVNDAVYSGMGYNLLPDERNDIARSMPVSVTESIRDARWKLIHERSVPPPPPGSAAAHDAGLAALMAEGAAKSSDTYELYDVAADPEELKDLAPRRPDLVESLGRRLKAWGDAARAAGGAAPAGSVPVSHTLIDAARKRGYWQ